MREYSFTEARQNFASILDEAKTEGVVCIKTRDSESFYIKPASIKKSPLDVIGIDLGISSKDIVSTIRESRERHYS